jgi:8-oxo-dGTP pyrophosphatase MutT (NUDIX family)
MNTAGGLVINKYNQILLIYRKDRWDLPKGKQEDKELLCFSAIREVQEETGINIDFIGIITPLIVTPYTKRDKKKRKTRYAFWFIMPYSNEDLRTYPQIEEKIEIARWVDFEELPYFISKGRSYLKPIFEAFEKNEQLLMAV